MIVAPKQSAELIALEGGAVSPATPAVVPQTLPIPASPATWLRNLTSQQRDRDSYSVTALADITDRAFTCRHGALHGGHLAGSIGGGISGLGDASCLCARQTHAARRQGDAQGDAVQQLPAKVRCVEEERRKDCIDPLPQDQRFTDEAWQQVAVQLHLPRLSCCNSNGGTTPRPACAAFPSSHEDMVEFVSRQILDMFSPSNFLLTNPEILSRTVAPAALNLVRGLSELSWRTGSAPSPARSRSAPTISSSAATSPMTPGKVVYRNRLIELIQYAPATRHGSAGADPDHSGVDHEILHPRSVAAEFAGQVSHRAGLHRLHDLLEESGSGRSRSRHGRLSDARRDGRARCGQRDRCPIAKFTPSAIAWAARCCRSQPRRWRATATSGLRR